MSAAERLPGHRAPMPEHFEYPPETAQQLLKEARQRIWGVRLVILPWWCGFLIILAPDTHVGWEVRMIVCAVPIIMTFLGVDHLAGQHRFTERTRHFLGQVIGI